MSVDGDGDALSERDAPSEHSLLGRALVVVTRWLLAQPLAVLAAVAFSVVASLAVTAWKLEYRPSRLDLLSQDSEYNHRWLAFLEEFGSDDDAVAVVEGDDPALVAAAARDLANLLAEEPEEFPSVYFENDFAVVHSKSLQLASEADLQRIAAFVEQLSPLARGDWRPLQIGAMLRQAPLRAASPEEQAQATAFFASLAAALAGEEYRSPWTAPAEQAAAQSDERRLPSGLLTTDKGRLAVVLVRLKRASADKPGANSAAIAALREAIAAVQAKHQNVRLGLTGMPILEDDEMRASQADTAIANVLGLLGVTALFAAGFGGLRHPVLTLISLLVAFAWSFAFISLCIGHLNILSMAFGAILIGLGIDFGIYYVASYLQLRTGGGAAGAAAAKGMECGEAIIQAAGSVGPGVVTGAVTTSLAFFTAGMTDFVGVAELGVIAGGGILLCLLAVIVVLPALIYVSDRHRPAGKMPKVLPFQIAYRKLSRRPAIVLAVAALVTCLALFGAGELKYDHNLLNLQPAELASVQWEHRLLERAGRGAWFAVSIADDDAEVAEKKRRFEALPSVDRVEEMASLLPALSGDKLATIDRIHAIVADMPHSPCELPLPSVEELSAALGRFEHMLIAGGQGDSQLGRAVSGALLSLSQSSRADCLARLGEFQRALALDTLRRLEELKGASQPAPLVAADLPAGLAERFVGKNGRLLLRVYARGDIWDMDALARFVQDVESVDAQVTGHPVQTYYASREMQDSYLQAALYSFVAVALILLIDLRSPSKMLLAFLPLALGVGQMFGLLGWLGISLNAANMICLPLIMGICIDGGVHVVHDYLRQTGGGRKHRYRMSRSTGAAVILSSATTIVGFGVMAFGRHQGLRSLGQVLTLGVTCSMLSSLFVLPAAISWFTNRRRRSHLEESSIEATDAPVSIEDREPEVEEVSPTSAPRLTPRRRRAA